jgi:lysophospholipase L1-like esterase
MKYLAISRLVVALAVFTILSTVVAADEPNPATTPASRPDEGWTKRHEKMNERVKQGNVDLIFIGDSITQAWEGQGELWNKFYGKRNAVNLGISGDQTAQVLWRLDHGNIDGISPKLAVIMIGTNNAGHAPSTPGEQIAEGITAVVAKLREKLPKTKILLLGIFPRGADKNDPLRQSTAKANEIVSKLADDQNVFYLDLAPKFLAEDGTLSTDIAPDLLHLSPKGYTIWAESIEPSVVKLMGEK